MSQLTDYSTSDAGFHFHWRDWCARQELNLLPFGPEPCAQRDRARPADSLTALLNLIAACVLSSRDPSEPPGAGSA